MLIFVLVWMFQINVSHKDIKRQSARLAAITAKYLGSVSALFLLFQPSLFDLVQTTLPMTLVFVASRISLLLAVFIFLVEILLEPYSLLSKVRFVKDMIDKGDIGIAGFQFGFKGPELIRHIGFNFLGEGPRSELEMIGVASMFVLGRGERYIEGSSILPIGPRSEYIGLALTGWMKDPSQTDLRMKGLTYMLHIIAVPKGVDWLFLDREFWEKSYRSYMRALEGNPNPEEGIEFVKELTFKVAAET